MIEIIGVRFKANGKVYYFSPGDHQFQTGDLVVVETSKGTECGEVTIPNKTIQQAAVVQPLKQILRPVNKEDRKTLEQNRKKEIRAFHICEEKIAMRKLEMKLIEVECAFDNSRRDYSLQILKIEKTDEPFAFSCLPYTAEEIENATHYEELPPARRTVLCVCGAVRGVGGIDSWGSDVEEAYRINAENVISYSFAIC